MGCPLTWSFEYGFDPKLSEALAAATGPAQGILLGRKTYEMFEEPWSSPTAENDPGASFFNDTTKYVVSGTLTDPTWRHSTVVGPYDPATIQALKGATGCGSDGSTVPCGEVGERAGSTASPTRGMPRSVGSHPML